MPYFNKKHSNGNIIIWTVIAFLGVFLLILTAFPWQYSTDELRNKWLETAVRQYLGAGIVILLMVIMKTRLFSRPQRLVFIIPCLIVAVNNFPFLSYFNGNMYFKRTETLDFVYFASYCLSVGLFEELVFRGVVFSALASTFSKDRQGVIKTFIISSVLFGFMHLFNLFSGAGFIPTLIQVLYTTLMGGIFAFVLLKTKNILCCAVTHALYNFGGLLLDSSQRMGLGSGVVFDTGTVVLTVILGVCVGVFILYNIFKYSETERSVLYQRLGLHN